MRINRASDDSHTATDRSFVEARRLSRTAQGHLCRAPTPAASHSRRSDTCRDGLADAEGVYQRLRSRAIGLTTGEAEARLIEHGPNIVAADGRKSLWLLLWHAVINPLVLLLAALATISFSTGDARAGIVMSLMIVLGVGLRLTQERRADATAAKLKAMISVTAAVLRDGQPQELPVAHLVPGDVVKLAAGDMIPADVRLLSCKTCSSSRAA